MLSGQFLDLAFEVAHLGKGERPPFLVRICAIRVVRNLVGIHRAETGDFFDLNWLRR